MIFFCFVTSILYCFTIPAEQMQNVLGIDVGPVSAQRNIEDPGNEFNLDPIWRIGRVLEKKKTRKRNL